MNRGGEGRKGEGRGCGESRKPWVSVYHWQGSTPLTHGDWQSLPTGKAQKRGEASSVYLQTLTGVCAKPPTAASFSRLTAAWDWPVQRPPMGTSKPLLLTLYITNSLYITKRSPFAGPLVSSIRARSLPIPAFMYVCLYVCPFVHSLIAPIRFLELSCAYQWGRETIIPNYDYLLQSY